MRFQNRLILKSAFCFLGVVSSCLCLGFFVESLFAQQRNKTTARFELLDQNNDQKVTLDEMDRPLLFKQIDKNNDGAITLDEASSFFQEANPPARIQTRQQMPKKADFRSALDVAYLPQAKKRGDLQTLDIYTPSEAKNGESRPVMVFVHGGGWAIGDKKSAGSRSAKMHHFVNEGYVFVSVNYRLSPKVKHPEHVKDIAAALAYVHDHIAEYGGDPEELWLMGHSAGAHLVALVSTDEQHLKAYDKPLSILKGTIPLDTLALDITYVQRQEYTRPSQKKMFTQAFGEPEEWKTASPAYFVEEGKGIPPFLIFSTGSRTDVAEVSQAFVEKLKTIGVSGKFIRASDKTHGSLNKEIGMPGDAPTEAIMQFIEKHRPEPSTASSQH
ncbi:Acetyl esterase/lipase [Planctomycetales bacterium 10988]|nr:Acetyl esterase/lipase [Planctomycetales bacterium 10988]